MQVELSDRHTSTYKAVREVSLVAWLTRMLIREPNMAKRWLSTLASFTSLVLVAVRIRPDINIATCKFLWCRLA